MCSKVWTVSLVLLLCCTYNTFCIEDDGLIISNAERLIDISSQIVKGEVKIDLLNKGDHPVTEFKFALSEECFDKVSFIFAYQDSEPLDIKSTNDPRTIYIIYLKKSLPSSGKTSVRVSYAITESLIPFPTHIKQDERQLVKYTGNSHFYSPYPVTKCVTNVELGTKNIENYTKADSTLEGHRIYYGFYNNLPPYSKNVIEIHYENNSPFLVVDKLIRTIEVSHWGNVAIEEEVTLVHTGAKLKGPFSRYDFQKDLTNGISSVRAFKTLLPKQAKDIYYRDEIGNISTSNVVPHEKELGIEIRPRFPLFGGWGTEYKLGYNLPLSSCVVKRSGKYMLRMNIVQPLYENMVVRELVLKVIFPEGTKIIKHDFSLGRKSVAFNVEKLPDDVHFTYLDIIGRPVVSFKMKNLSTFHTKYFYLEYEYPTIYMLLEPFLLFSSILIFILLVIIYVRLDFSLSKDEISEHKLKVSGIKDKVLSLQDGRASAYKTFESKLTDFKYNKDINFINTHAKTFSSDHKNYTNQIADVATQLKNEAPEMVDKIAELQKLDRELKAIYTQQQTLYTDKLTPGKVSKAAFGEQDSAISKQKEECLEKIAKIVKSVE